MTLHTLKCWPAFYDAIESGDKTFELRLDDRGFQRGDKLWLCRTREDDNNQIEFEKVDKDGKPLLGALPLHSLFRLVSYTLHGPKFGLAPGYVIMALKEE